ncbi:MAG TPA: anti-sigma factor [Longimicrobiaceae bacterium]|nr:anti-sigma factor [Longimicrobiaceae bacterium]
MSHPGEGTLLALLDGELGEEDRRAAERHLEGCAACAAEFRALGAERSVLGAALQRTDAPPRVAEALMAVRRRRAPARRTVAWAPLGKAAVLLLGFAGIASAAVPGSPVRHWLASVAVPGAAPAAPPNLGVAPAPAAARLPEVEAPSGVSIAPDGGEVRVVLTGAGPEVRVRARVGEGEQVEVTAHGAAAGARFRAGPGRVAVVGARAGEVEVLIPRAARTATVEADGRVLLARQDGRTRLLAPVVDDPAPGMVFRVGP